MNLKSDNNTIHHLHETYFSSTFGPHISLVLNSVTSKMFTTYHDKYFTCDILYVRLNPST